MDIQVTRREGVTLARPQEDLTDMTAAAEVKQRLGSLIGMGQSKLVVDLARVFCIDGAGMGALVGAAKQARAVGGTFTLCGLREDVRSIVEMTRLSRVLAIGEDVQGVVTSW